MDLRDREDRAAYLAWLDGTFGDPIHIAQGGAPNLAETEMAVRFSCLLGGARKLIEAGLSPARAAKQLGIGRATAYRIAKTVR